MNKNQLITAWVMGITICIVWTMWWFDPMTTTPRCLLVSHVIAIVIGSLAVYTLRDKK